ncbi:MAG: hypothetical protein HC788_15210 [Sphingopyxis sp.]|nr:hypothetical protein [Sphingopyxis sp.]
MPKADEIDLRYAGQPSVAPADGLRSMVFDKARDLQLLLTSVVAIDPDSGRLVRAIDVAAHAGTAFDGQYLFQIAEDRIQKIDPGTGDVLSTIPALRDVFVLVQTHADLIRAKKPSVSKNSCGYNLFGLADGLADGRFDLPKLLVGSEGTLGVVSEARLSLVEKPKATLTALIHLRHLQEVGEAVPHLLALSPSALEVMDANTLDLIGRAKHGVPAEAAATLLIELDADSFEVDLHERAEQMAAVCRSFTLASELTLAFDPEQREQLWKARKALYPTLYRFDPQKKPINFVDDVVVRAERISELIHYLEQFFEGQHVPVAIFGHIGNGNAH